MNDEEQMRRFVEWMRTKQELRTRQVVHTVQDSITSSSTGSVLFPDRYVFTYHSNRTKYDPSQEPEDDCV